MDRFSTAALVPLLLAALSCPALGQKAVPATQPAKALNAPASAPAKSVPPAASASRGDPFSGLVVVTPVGKLPPLASVRVRDKREVQDRSREGNVTISIGTQPKGAAVTYGSKSLGTTPITLSAQRGSTPYDVVIHAKGFMTLHVRIVRKTARSYFFKLTPAKLR
jgi:hypothetical protein